MDENRQLHAESGRRHGSSKSRRASTRRFSAARFWGTVKLRANRTSHPTLGQTGANRRGGKGKRAETTGEFRPRWKLPTSRTPRRGCSRRPHDAGGPDLGSSRMPHAATQVTAGGPAADAPMMVTACRIQRRRLRGIGAVEVAHDVGYMPHTATQVAGPSQQDGPST